MEYYYKSKDGTILIRTSHQKSDENLIEINEKEYKRLNPTSRVDKEKERIKKEISKRKAELALTDYQAIKYAEGWITEEEYAPIKAHRQTLRDEINELLEELK